MDLVTGLRNESRACLRKPHPPPKLTATYLGQTHFPRMSHEHAAFALCVDLLLRILDQKLPVIRIGKRARKTVVVACTDDITIFATIPTELRVISDAITSYEKSTGARLNTRKSKELPVGGWNTSTDPLIIPWPAEIKILGFTFASTIEHSMKKSWANEQARL
jgi:hypothetical protein